MATVAEWLKAARDCATGMERRTNARRRAGVTLFAGSNPARCPKRCGMIDLRLGDWREALHGGWMVSTIVTDPPYGKRTHDGNANLPERCSRSDLSGYANWTASDAAEFIAAWSERCLGWFCIMTSDDLITPIRDAYSAAKRLDFAPVPILQHRVRMGGDGPGSGAVYLMVARPRRKEFLS